MNNKAKWKNFSIEEIEKIIKESISYNEVCRKMGYADRSGNITRIKNKIDNEWKLDTSHFLSQSWNKGNYNYNKFQEHTKLKRDSTFNPLISIRGRKCENCGIEEWLGKPINLEVHHIDGDRSNNSLDNLQLLCPNCHSYTENFRKSRFKHKRIVPDDEFVAALAENKSIRQALIQLEVTPCGGNYERAWYLIYEYNIEHLKK